MRLILYVVLLAACHRGDIDEDCNPDGTCNAPQLSCQHFGNGPRCSIRPPEDKRTCHSDADCFCEHCLTRCGSAGIKMCAYTDVSVWGSKPTICECRETGSSK